MFTCATKEVILLHQLRPSTLFLAAVVISLSNTATTKSL